MRGRRTTTYGTHDSTNGVPRSPFDRALELQALGDAADAYAAKRAEPGTDSYRTAWLRFRQRFESMEELMRWRASAARRTQDRAVGRPHA